ncbi:unnamed protein product [Litomosoides sigmodontis]|uniref:Uncharacterized protein n=1 Tax=Litomosoides sigmodontis TaxID=42156 RepID=A0A3P6U587_LITSI|nr:unnamed protein product [Litomosoides sigmodontis]
MSMMLVLSNISKTTFRIFPLLIITITIASTFDFGELMYGDDELQEQAWKRSNAELINGLIGMNLGHFANAGKRSVSALRANDKSVSNGQRFKKKI